MAAHTLSLYMRSCDHKVHLRHKPELRSGRAVRLPPAKDDHEPMVVVKVNVFGPVSWASWLHTGFECRGHLHERNGLIG
jgi:hypothetical protein